MRGLKSYRLKTVVMLMVRENPNRFWELDHEDFLDVLEELRDHLANGSIPYYFDRKHNLILGMPDWRKAEIAGFIDEAIDDLRMSLGTEHCYDTWRKYFD